MVASAMIEVRDVGKSYGAGRIVRPVIEHCSFTVERNKFTVMIGPSGAGKSTVIRLIAGFEKPSSGEILIDGRVISGPSRERLVLFQESALFPWMRTEENISYGPKACAEPWRDYAPRVRSLLDKVGLRSFRRQYPAQLSGGMQRRAELARALVNNPAIMILDEPFRGLDAMTKRLMLDYYATLSEGTSRTNLFVTTDIDEAIFLADRLLVMGSRPMCLKAAFDVDLPRPRQFGMLVQSDRANAIKMETLSLLHEEAMKAFGGGRQTATDFVEAYRRRVMTNDHDSF
jgi:NitT/TauT family transport system ATP-binding protein